MGSFYKHFPGLGIAISLIAMYALLSGYPVVRPVSNTAFVVWASNHWQDHLSVVDRQRHGPLCILDRAIDDSDVVALLSGLRVTPASVSLALRDWRFVGPLTFVQAPSQSFIRYFSARGPPTY
jgi:hypothetical protein